MATTNVDPLEISTRDSSLKVIFTWQNDRFVHAIYQHGRQVGHSLHGNANDPWPVSPPLQQLSKETMDGFPVLLGVGSAGKGHWSLSLETVDQQSLRFELACRSPTDPPTQVGSAYDCDRSLPIKAGSSSRLLWDQSSTGDTQRCVTVQPTVIQSGTTRWSYQLTSAC